ncbi:ran-binding protein 3-like isoform X1 [Chanos chanos]|uniref:Ran-binding protein 3-like isoform X1 n=1 Tax=Chanos chanos TaxID=29144 RepID=A0A6J2UX28_CHACN|nr:ran-binding protein 3-like isoform X1 [Chanos chanos]
MRGNQLSPASDAASCPRMMSLSSDFRSDALGPASTTSDVRGTTTLSAPSHGQLSTTDCSTPVSCAQSSVYPLARDRPVLAPPVFIFQKVPTPVKRRAESEDGSVVGTGVSKRIRSLTYPSLCNRARIGPSDNGRRARSASLSFPPPLPVSRSNVFMPSNMCNLNKVSPGPVLPRVKVRRTLLRPALLVAPQPWKSQVLPHLTEVSLEAAEDLSRVTIDPPSSTCALNQRAWPQENRNFSATDTSASEGVQFVFGENMSERVLSPTKTPYSEEMTDSDCSSSDSESSSSDLTHKLAVRRTLWESAAAYTASCGRRCLLKQVQVFTGEEKESNVVQLTCKLFVLEKGTQSWSERGRGVLRLNDLAIGTKGTLQSRIVMRHQGSLKVILNTKLWPHTQLRRPARRNLQVTATDLESHAVRVFLIQASAKDIARLYVAIHHRLVALRCSAAGLGGDSAGLRDREGHCSSEDEEEEEDRRQPVKEEKVLKTHMRMVDCSRKHSYPKVGPR